MKYLMGLLCFILTTVNATPFGFKYGQSKQSIRYPIIDNSPHQYCKLTDYPQVNSFYLPDNESDFNLSVEVRSNYKTLGVYRLSELKDLKTMRYIIDYPFPILQSTTEAELYKLSAVKNEHRTTDVYKRKKYIFDKLSRDPIYKEFSNFKPSPYNFETIVYKLPNANICAQFKNNALIQIGFNNKGISKEFNKVVQAITSKYKGNSKTYNIQNYSNRVAMCGYTNEKNECFVKDYIALTETGEHIKVIYHDTKFESSFFSRGLPDKDKHYKYPFVNYYDGNDLRTHKITIEKEQNKYNSVIMKKLYLKLHELFNESKALQNEKDSFLEQF